VFFAPSAAPSPVREQLAEVCYIRVAQVAGETDLALGKITSAE